MMNTMRIVMSIAVLAVLAGVAGTAAAGPTLTPITNRDFALDMWSSIPFGDSDAMAMGGANVAKASGSSGALDNPAASAIRKSTDDTWGFDITSITRTARFPATTATPASLQALGITPNQTSQQLTLGGALRVYNWGAAISGTVRSMNLGEAADGSGPVFAESLLFKGSLAHFFEGPDIAIGVGAQLAILNMQIDCSGPQCGNLFTIGAWGAQFGATWIPHMTSFRLGAVLSTGISGDNVTGGSCMDPNNCEGFILPESRGASDRHRRHRLPVRADRVEPADVGRVPRRASADPFDVVTNAPVENAYGIDAYAIGYLERSGEHSGVSPRGASSGRWCRDGFGCVAAPILGAEPLRRRRRSRSRHVRPRAARVRGQCLGTAPWSHHAHRRPRARLLEPRYLDRPLAVT